MGSAGPSAASRWSLEPILIAWPILLGLLAALVLTASPKALAVYSVVLLASLAFATSLALVRARRRMRGRPSDQSP